MIKNIVFDIGNVLVEFKPMEFLRNIYNDDKVIDSVYNAVFKSKCWPELDRGTMTEEEAAEEFCISCPECEASIREVVKRWYEMLIPMEDSIKILIELKAKGYKIYALSNYQVKGFEKIYRENDFFKEMDGMVISCRIKSIKPEREIYEYLLNEYKLLPDETLFIDDTVENLKGAEEFGIKTFQFTTADKLRLELKNLDIF